MSIALAQRTFPDLLRRWRGARRVSQLELALRANVSARHISFLESERARPSRGMVLTLATALEVPLAERNALLGAAGFAPAYRERAADDLASKLPSAALAWMLDRHAPYPGFAFDRHWRVLRANDPAKRLLAAAGLCVGDSMLEATGPGGSLRELICNWPEVARYFASRLQTESEHYGGDPLLDAYREQLSSDAVAAPSAPTTAILPIVYRMGDECLSFFSTIAHFGNAVDIALDSLRIELMFPADDATAAALLALADPPGGE